MGPMPPQTPLVSLVLVTMRPSFLPAICAMLDRQTYAHTELVVVLHGHEVIGLLPDERLALESARAVLEMPSSRSLGHCLNAAIAESRGIFVAKIDDDDLYGREYLAEMVGHLLAEDGDVVGKAEIYVYLEESGTVVLRKPGASLKTVKFVAGATLAFSRSLALQCPFRDVASRAGAYFLEDSRINGATAYSTSRRNFMCVRRAAMDGHTWRLPDNAFIENGIVLRRHRHATLVELLAMIDESVA